MVISQALKKSAALALCGLVLSSTAVLTGCVTTTYGQSFVRDEKVANQFKLKVYVNAFSGADSADKQAKAEIDKYAAAQKMTGGTIVNRTYNLLPEYYEYTVRFTPR